MAMLDNLVVNVAMPSIQHSLHANVSQLEWFVNAYTLAFVVMMLPFSVLADRYGRRGMFMLGLALFTVGSLGSGLSSFPMQLELARALQGFGSAAIMPLTLSYVSDAFPPQNRSVGIGIVSGVSGLGLTMGPLVGGLIINSFHWQMIFWVNIPVGVLVLLLTPFWMPRVVFRSAKGMDVAGFLLVSLGLFGVVWGLTHGNTEGWGAPLTWGSMTVGVVLLTVFLWWENRATEPFVHLHLFRNRQYSVINVAGFWMFAGVFGAIFLLTLFLQEAMGFSALGAGAREMYWTAATMVAAPAAGILVKRLTHRSVLLLGFTLQALALGYFAVILSAGGLETPFTRLIPAMIGAGIGMGLSITPLSDGILAVAKRDNTGQASGMNNALRELGGVFGIAIAGAVFQNAGQVHSATEFVHHVVPALWVCTVMMGLALTVTLGLKSNRTDGASQRSKSEVSSQPESV